MNRRRASSIAGRVEAWFPAAARPLPWRQTSRDLYHALVAETMAQQTQIARVAERFIEFVRAFPSVRELADADERRVLALWSGLGYYRRARNLHRAARRIVDLHGGRVPSSPELLRSLPGVGPYTAGAIASIAAGVRTPIVDGNIRRVLIRLQGQDLPPGDASTTRWAWSAAAELVAASARPGVLNEGLMELGATICTPRSPDCGHCPLATLCVARRDGRADRIPRAKPSTPATRREALYCASVLVRDTRGRVLVEQRADAGMWSGLWQAPTVEQRAGPPTRAQAAAAAGIGLQQIGRSPVESFTHITSHRIIRFDAWAAVVRFAPSAVTTHSTRQWTTRAQFHRLGLSTPQRRILSAAASHPPPAGR